MTAQKGFAPLIIIVILALVAGVAGFFFLQNSKTSPTSILPNLNLPQADKTSESDFYFELTDKKQLFTGGYADPSVIKLKDGSYIMYVNTFGSQGSANLIYTSADGVNWNKTSYKAPGSATLRGFVDGDKIRVYYPTATPINPSDPPSQIISAVSSDGLTFTTDSGTRVKPLSGSIVEGPAVIKLPNGKYRMYFDEFPESSKQERNGGKIYGATSDDGLAWTRDEKPSIESDSTVERSPANWPQALRPFVIARPKGGFIMFYNSHSQIFAAVSTDGYSWTKLGTLGIKGADLDAVYLSDGNLRVYFGDFSESTSGVVYTGLLKDISGKNKNTPIPNAPTSGAAANTNMPAPQECVGKTASDPSLPESCKLWFNMQSQ